MLSAVEGTEIATSKLAPPALIANLRYNKVLHDRTYILSIRTADLPRVPAEERSEIIDLGIRPEDATYFLDAESLSRRTAQSKSASKSISRR